MGPLVAVLLSSACAALKGASPRCTSPKLVAVTHELTQICLGEAPEASSSWIVLNILSPGPSHETGRRCRGGHEGASRDPGAERRAGPSPRLRRKRGLATPGVRTWPPDREGGASAGRARCGLCRDAQGALSASPSGLEMPLWFKFLQTEDDVIRGRSGCSEEGPPASRGRGTPPGCSRTWPPVTQPASRTCVPRRGERRPERAAAWLGSKAASGETSCFLAGPGRQRGLGWGRRALSRAREPLREHT